MKKAVCITGAAGYIGTLLVEHYVSRTDTVVVAIDTVPCPSAFVALGERVVYIQKNTRDTWEDMVKPYAPHTVIHAAWHIREAYGKDERARQRADNIEGSKKVFSFACKEGSSVETLIFFSTAAVYSARRDNSEAHYFTEEEGPRHDTYSYASEKREAEMALRTLWSESDKRPACVVVRPVAVTGPCMRAMRTRFGLQSVLHGTLAGGFVHRVVLLLTYFFPAPRRWARQFIHEDDVVGAVEAIVQQAPRGAHTVYNLTPYPDEYVDRDAMARVLGKRVLPVTPLMVRLAFFVAWHITRGAIPTARGVWRFYSYPLLLSGKKLSRIYACAHSSLEAIRAK